jgi:hypothetical protein
MKKSLLATIFVVFVALLIAACGPKTQTGGKLPTGKTIKAAPIGNLTVTLSNESGQLKHGDQEFMVTFTDASGKPVDVGAASLNFHMAQMGTMAAMNDQATLTTTETPGVYRAKVNIEVAGEWQAQIAYEGPAGSGKATVTVSAQ